MTRSMYLESYLAETASGHLVTPGTFLASQLRGKAKSYADAFVEYTAAQANVEANGAIVADPRTGSPIQNPYLVVRDKAFARLENLHKAGVRAPGLWQ